MSPIMPYQPDGDQPAELIVQDVNGYPVRFGAAEDGTPFAVASDYAKAMGYIQASDATRLLDDGEAGQQIVLSRSASGVEQRRSMNVVYEDGMWELIFRSSLPGAKAIKARVKAILKEIRETGRYSVEPAAPALPQDYEEALVALLGKVRENKALTAQVAELEPAAHAWDTLASGEGNYSVADAAKILQSDPTINTGPRKLFPQMIDLKWLYVDRGDGAYRARQTAIASQLLAERPQSYEDPRTGARIIKPPQVRVTVKGIRKLHKELGGSSQLRFN